MFCNLTRTIFPPLQTAIFFLTKPVSENLLLSFLNTHTPASWSSASDNNHPSKNLVQFIDYSGDICCGITLTCSDDLFPALNNDLLARELSCEFQTGVIVELWTPHQNFEYLLLDENGALFLINLGDNNDEVQIKNKTNCLDYDPLKAFKSLLSGAKDYVLTPTGTPFFYEVYFKPGNADMLIHADDANSLLMQSMILLGAAVE